MAGNEKLEAQEFTQKIKLLAVLDNFWYHHKWKVIVAAFLVLVIGFCTVQSCSRESYDITVMFAGPSPTAEIRQNDVIGAFGSLLQNDERAVKAGFVGLQIYSEEQIEEMKEANSNAADVENSGGYNITAIRRLSTENYSSFFTYVQSGEYTLYLLDPWLYEDLLSKGALVKLSDVLDKSTELSFDKYGVRFKDTDFYKDNAEIFSFVSDDTVLCLRVKAVMGNSSAYDSSVRLLEAILNYRSKELQ